MTSPNDFRYSSYKHLINRFMLHGSNYIFSKDISKTRRAIWIGLFACALAYFFVALHSDLSRYLSYEETNIQLLDYVHTVHFPAITVCPINHFISKKFDGTILKTIYKKHGLPITTSWKDTDFDVSGDKLFNTTIDSSFKLADIMFGCDFIRRDTNHPFVEPNYCGPDKFVQHITENNEICFTLNSPRLEEEDPLKTNFSGFNYGYEMKFDMKVKESTPIYPYNGFKVILHDRNELPIFDNGFLITTGVHYLVDLEPTETQNVHASSYCDKKRLKYFKTYSQKSCLLELLTDVISEKCGCREPYMPDNGKEYCSLRRTINCVLPAKDEFEFHKGREDSCPLPCTETSFSYMLTDVRFLHNPPQGFDERLVKKKLQRKPFLNNRIHDLYLSFNDTARFGDYIEDNIVSVLFYFGEMEQVTKIKKLAFTLNNVVANAAWFLKAMVGASILTLYRVLELLALFLYYKITDKVIKSNPDESYFMMEPLEEMDAISVVTTDNDEAALLSGE